MSENTPNNNHLHEKYYMSEDGLRLCYRDYQPTTLSGKTTILCLHSLSRNSKDFIHIAEKYMPERRVICPDFRGRGLSEYDPDYKNYKPITYLHDTFKLLNLLEIKHLFIIGSSLGGIVAMMMADHEKNRITGMVLNDIGPEFDEVGYSRIRQYMGLLPSVNSWPEAIDQAKHVYGNILHDLSDEEWRAFTNRTYKTASTPNDDKPILDMDNKLGNALREVGGKAVDMWRLFENTNSIPTLSIRGELSDFLSEETFLKMAQVNPNLIQITVPKRGHTPILNEQVCVDAIRHTISEADKQLNLETA